MTTDINEYKRQTLAHHLRRHVRGEVRFDKTTRRLYSTDASIYQIEPLGVVIPKTAEDVAAVVQVAGEMHIPITARGGGTSLSGQSIGPGVIVDCSKYLNAVLDINTSSQSALIQPGVVLDQFNRALASHGLAFGPDVATASRANLGGMIGNNSAGSRSLVYGMTLDHVKRLGVILVDGKRTDFGAVTPREWERRAAGKSLEGALYRSVRQIVKEHAAEIRRRFPRIPRRVSGYNLDTFADFFHSGEPGALATGGYLATEGFFDSRLKNCGLNQLLVGSEGTLGLVVEAEVNLVRRPKARGLLIPHFTSLQAAMDALAACLEFAPTAVELLDQRFIDLARENLSLRDTMSAIRGRPAALFMVEFSSDDEAEVSDRIERLQRRLGEVPGITALVQAVNPALREPLWNLRRAALPLLLGMPGDQKPVTFVEDTAVAPERLPEFVARFQEVLRRHGTEGAFYGHASVGCLHIRPLLNIKDPADVIRMRRITEEVTDLLLEFGGALSGEHGDGLARSEWNRKMFGPEVYEAFRRIKHAFDPHNLFNPGKVVDAPAMTENLRYGPNYAPRDPVTLFDYSKQEGFVRSIEMCNGSGVCRKLEGGTMCPSFRATMDEKDSTRGRANALRLALAGEEPVKDLRSQWVHDVLDLCLMCKACKSECPSNVDLAKLKAEFLENYYQARLRPLGQVLISRIYRLNQIGAAFATVTNFFQGRGWVRWLMEKTAGIDRRRSLPFIHPDHFRLWFRRHRKRSGEPGALGEPGVSAPGGRAVLLLDDCFTTYNEPEIGKAAVRVLERAGCSVELAGLTCCCRPMISKGFLSQAREMIQKQAPYLAQRIAAGTPLLGLEPSCLLTLVDEWPELAPGPDTKRIAAAAELAEGWLAKQVKLGRCDLKLKPLKEKCVVHGHCHQKALVGMGGTKAGLSLIPELQSTILDTGCCGMAGSFGFEKEHYDLSVQIANLSLLPELAKEPDALVVAPGTSCRHQIKDLAGRKALHPMEVLAKGLDDK